MVEIVAAKEDREDRYIVSDLEAFLVMTIVLERGGG